MKNRWKFLICFFVVTIFCLLLFKLEYATDSYSVAFYGAKDYSSWVLSNGRPVLAGFFYVFGLISRNFAVFYYISFFFCLIFASLSIYALAGFLEKFFSEKISILLAIIFILNPLSVEYFLFAEKGFFFVSIYLSLLAVIFFDKFLSGKKTYIIWCAICLVPSFLIYQIMPSFYVILATLLIILYSKNLKGFVVNTLIGAGIYGFAVICNFVTNSLFGENHRIGNNLNIGSFFDAVFILGKFYSILIYLVIVIILFILCQWKTKKSGHEINNFWLDFLKCIFMALGTLVIINLPFLTLTDNVAFAVRLLSPATFLILDYIIFFTRDFQPTLTKKQTKFISCVIFLVILIEFAFFATMFVGRIETNRQDKLACLNIGNYISQYEQETGFLIENICIYHDQKIMDHYPGVLYVSDSNIACFARSWSDMKSLSIYLNRPFNRLEPDENIYETYFDGKNWNRFDESQLVFVENTLHLCVF